MQTQAPTPEFWTHRNVFVMALLGISIGLGNVWRFSYLVLEHGGATFILVYLACMFLVGVPVMKAEVYIGRSTRSAPIHAFNTLAQENAKASHWHWFGKLATLSSFLIVCLYMVVASWLLLYFKGLITQELNDVNIERAGHYFNNLLQNSEELFWAQTLFMGLLCVVSMLGIRRGLETAIRILIPTLVVFIVILLSYTVSMDTFIPASMTLLSFHQNAINLDMLVAALSHVFFTLSLGTGAVMTYGSYYKRHESITTSVICVGLYDCLLAIMIGLIVLPILSNAQLELISGPSLIFVYLPVAFNQLLSGITLAALFFAMILLASFTSMLAMLEPSLAWLQKSLSIKRYQAAILTCVSAWATSIWVIRSINHWSTSQTQPMIVFDWFNLISTQLLVPLSALGLVLFAAWSLTFKQARRHASLTPAHFFAWQWRLRFLAGPAIAFILCMNLYKMVQRFIY